jgi:nitrite reductase/ring-hydroxylating ferredoxin subunit
MVKKTKKLDFGASLPAADLVDGAMISGRVGKEAVLLVRVGEEIFAINAKCTHYGGPLGEGVTSGETVRGPWHHACFSLRTGEALRAPAIDPVARWRVERSGDRIFVREKLPKAAPAAAAPAREPRDLVVASSLSVGRLRCGGAPPP